MDELFLGLVAAQFLSLIGLLWGGLSARVMDGRAALGFAATSVVLGVPLTATPLVDGDLTATLVSPGIALGIATLGVPLGLLGLAKSFQLLRVGRGGAGLELVRGACAITWGLGTAFAAMIIVHV